MNASTITMNGQTSAIRLKMLVTRTNTKLMKTRRALIMDDKSVSG